MTILKVFGCVIVIVSIIYIVVIYERKKRKEKEEEKVYANPIIEGTIENPLEEEERESIIFSLKGGSLRKTWKFTLTNHLTLIGRQTKEFLTSNEIQGDLTMSREQLAFQQQKDGSVGFMALKETNPIYIYKNNQWQPETNHFRLEPNRINKLKLGKTEFEVFFRGSSAPEESNQGNSRKRKNLRINESSNMKTQLWKSS